MTRCTHQHLLATMDMHNTTVGYYCDGCGAPFAPATTMPTKDQLVALCNTLAHGSAWVMLPGHHEIPLAVLRQRLYEAAGLGPDGNGPREVKATLITYVDGEQELCMGHSFDMPKTAPVHHFIRGTFVAEDIP